ncbi:hypothetical protein HRbin38_00147 [bacterium HR38]|nr:hypothetical protein HRbin38_00147 [bacterium HR38]
MVGDEDGKGQAFHHHHGCGRRNPAQESEKGQGSAPKLQGQGQHVEVRVLLGEEKPAPKGQGKDGQVDEEKVQGEGPGRQAEVPGVGVFHHAHVELPGQEEEGQAGKDHQARPFQVTGKALLGEEEGEELGMALDPGKRVSQLPEDHPSHEEEGQELHEGLKGHRQHQALVPLRGIQAAGAEEDGEEGQEQGGGKGDVREGFLLAPEEEEGLGDGLELQGQVGKQAHHQKGGGQGTKKAVAEAQVEEVGPGGEAVGAGQGEQLSVKKRPKEEDQGGPQVDGEEAGSLHGRPAHASHEGPGGGVDRQGKGVRPGALDQKAAPSLPQEGHQEEEAQVEEKAQEKKERVHGRRNRR